MGDVEGAAVGDSDGAALGDAVGDVVGARVGRAVGDLVGDFVGHVSHVTGQRTVAEYVEQLAVKQLCASWYPSHRPGVTVDPVVVVVVAVDVVVPVEVVLDTVVVVELQCPHVTGHMS